MNAKDRIVHHITSEPTSVIRCLEKHFRLQSSRIEELFALGAIYSNKKRVTQDRALEKGAYLRIHLQPKRFPMTEVDWSRVVVHEDRDFLVVNKPAGIPVHATVDNALDNVLHQLRVLTGKSLLVTQRLDVPVGGLIVFGKNPDFQRRYNQWLVDRKVEKTYLALVEAAPPVGRHLHYMEPSERSPKRVGLEALPGWINCELSVLSTAACSALHETQIALHTGRTHQIRAQLAALGTPIVGDRMYGSARHYPVGVPGTIALFSARLNWRTPGPNPVAKSFELDPPWKGLSL